MINIFWFRRDLRLEDNTGLFNALNRGEKVLPIFVFDTEIISQLSENDARITFIYEQLNSLNQKLEQYNSSLLVLKGKPLEVFKKLTKEYAVQNVFTNKDYESYAIQRDSEIKTFLNKKGIDFNAFKDQVIFEENEVLKADNTPYTVFTPYKKKWIQAFNQLNFSSELKNKYDYLNSEKFDFPTLNSLGFKPSKIKVKPYTINNLKDYKEQRDFPYIDQTSYLSAHLRFGTISIRKIVAEVKENESFLSELIWREFFMQILFNFPYVVHQNFRKKYDAIPWRNNSEEFKKWKNGKTGYPFVDAGMRQLNKTGYMHNRVRIIVAGFLCKHLLIDWRLGEAYFAEKLLDYELSSNNGNWQWAAGTGCDAAPYFRVFNPETQLKKFDKELKYVRKWIKDFDELTYQQPMVEHKMARQRAIDTYKKALNDLQ